MCATQCESTHKAEKTTRVHSVARQNHLLCIQATGKSSDCLALWQSDVYVRGQEHFPTSHQHCDQSAEE